MSDKCYLHLVQVLLNPLSEGRKAWFNPRGRPSGLLPVDSNVAAGRVHATQTVISAFQQHVRAL